MQKELIALCTASSWSRLSDSPFFCATCVALLVLACSSRASGAEIHDAARDGNLAKVKAALNGNPGLVSSTDKEGLTPLHWAAEKGHKDVAALLLANKAEVNARASNGFTPLHYAAFAGHNDVAALLLANKAEVNAKTVDTSMAPL